MKQAITAQVVMLPQDKEGWSKGDILSDSEGHLKIATYDRETFLEDWAPQHIYFITNEPIQGGDWVFDGDTIFQCDYVDAYTKINGWRRVTASTDPALGLPAIPIAWIRDVYVPSNGSIKEVKLETYEYGNETEPKLHLNALKLTFNNEVVIVDEAMDIFEKVVDGYVSHEEGLKQLKQMQTEQELEDAANKYSEGNSLEYAYMQEIPAFKAGAAWQKEQSTIPTDEEIEDKAHNDYTYGYLMPIGSYDRSRYEEKKESYTAGYKQALKDLGYADN